MSVVKPAALFVCVALAGCAGKSDSASTSAKGGWWTFAGEEQAAQAETAKPSQAQSKVAEKTEAAVKAAEKKPGVAARQTSPAAQQDKPAVAAKAPAQVAVAQKAVKEAKPAGKESEQKGSWWSFGSKKKEAAQAAAPKKAEVRKVSQAWLDDNEKRLKAAVAGSKFQVERRGDVLVVVAPADPSFNPDRPHMLLPVTLGPLTRVAKLVGSDPQAAVLVLGHADSSGNPERNRKLSLERAQAIASIFRMSGLKNDRLMLRGLGSDQPRASNDNATGRSQNRRVELLLTLRDSLPALVAQNGR